MYRTSCSCLTSACPRRSQSANEISVCTKTRSQTFAYMKIFHFSSKFSLKNKRKMVRAFCRKVTFPAYWALQRTAQEHAHVHASHVADVMLHRRRRAPNAEAHSWSAAASRAHKDIRAHTESRVDIPLAQRAVTYAPAARRIIRATSHDQRSTLTRPLSSPAASKHECALASTAPAASAAQPLRRKTWAPRQPRCRAARIAAPARAG